MQTWPMQTVKARFSDVVRGAKSNGPQDITIHGKSVALVLSRELYDRLSGNTQSLVQFMQSSPVYGMEEVVFERDTSVAREVNL